MTFSDEKPKQEKITTIPVQCPCCGKNIEFQFQHHHETTSTSELVFIREKKETQAEG